MCTKLSALSPLAKYWLVQLFFVCTAVTLGVIEQYRFGHHYRDSIMPYTGNLFDVAGFLAFYCVSVVHLGLQYQLAWRWRFITTLVVIALYVSSYCLLSFNGKYHASRSGHYRWNSMGLAVVDQDLWHAKGVFWQPFRTIKGQDTFQATYLGHFYSPLIRLDRTFIHRTINIVDGKH